MAGTLKRDVTLVISTGAVVAGIVSFLFTQTMSVRQERFAILDRQVAQLEKKEEQLKTTKAHLEELKNTLRIKDQEVQNLKQELVDMEEAQRDPAYLAKREVKSVISSFLNMFEINDYSQLSQYIYPSKEGLEESMQSSPVNVRNTMIVSMELLAENKAKATISYEYTDLESLIVGMSISNMLRQAAEQLSASQRETILHGLTKDEIPMILSPRIGGFETYGTASEDLSLVRRNQKWAIDVRRGKGVLFYVADAGGYRKQSTDNISRLIGDDEVTRMTGIISLLALDLEIDSDSLKELMLRAAAKKEEAQKKALDTMSLVDQMKRESQ